MAQLLLSGGFFVLLVAVKLLFPAKMAQWSGSISDAMQRNMDVAAVFSTVRDFCRFEDVRDNAKVYLRAAAESLAAAIALGAGSGGL